MRSHLLHLLVLLLLGLTLVFYKFNEIPKNIAFDEVEFAKIALSLDKSPYASYTTAATGHATPYFYLILTSFKIFGINNFALRLPAALFGLGSVVMFYLLIKLLLKDRLIPLLASFILITSRWFLTFARFSFEATFLLFLEMTSICFLFKYLDYGRHSGKSKTHPESKQDPGRARMTLVLSGIFAAIAFNSYLPGRIFFILPLSFVIFSTKNDFVKRLKQSLYFVVPFLILVLPLTIYLVSHPDIRLEEQFFLKNSALSASQKLITLFENLKSTILMFFTQGDMNGRHNFPGKPAINPILSLFMVAGLFFSVKNLMKVENKLLLSYFLISLIPTILSSPSETPNMLRTFTVLPSVAYFVALGVGLFIDKAKKYRRIAAGVASILILISSLYELRTYFQFQNRVFKNSFEVKCDIGKLKDSHDRIFDADVKLVIGSIPKDCWVQKNEF